MFLCSGTTLPSSRSQSIVQVFIICLKRLHLQQPTLQQVSVALLFTSQWPPPLWSRPFSQGCLSASFRSPPRANEDPNALTLAHLLLTKWFSLNASSGLLIEATLIFCIRLRYPHLKTGPCLCPCSVQLRP